MSIVISTKLMSTIDIVVKAFVGPSAVSNERLFSNYESLTGKSASNLSTTPLKFYCRGSFDKRMSLKHAMVMTVKIVSRLNLLSFFDW